MAKFAISQEGADAMEALANNLVANANAIEEASKILQQKTAQLGDGLGIYAEAIQSVIRQNQGTLLRHRDEFQHLSSRARQIADSIRQLAASGLSAGAGVSSGSGAQTGGAMGGDGASASAGAASLAPNRTTPRDLPVSQFGFQTDSDGNQVYDSPMETNQYLYTQQGSANADYQGTCGLCSCANILRLAGVNLSEGDMIAYASTTKSSWFGNLCSTGYSNPDMNGGTSPKDRQEILSHFGIDSSVLPVFTTGGSVDQRNIKLIADGVSSGRGVILSVHADMLWYDAAVGLDDYHAVTVTSVKKNSAGDVLGFYICDSADGGTTYYPADKVIRCLTGAPMNITHQIIR